MDKLKFGIDVDGVLRNLTGGLIKLFNSTHTRQVTMDQFIYYDVNAMFPELEDANRYFFTGNNARQILRYSEPMPGAQNAFKILQELGKVYIITSQTGYENISNTLFWLSSNQFECDQICFIKDKSIVSGLDYFIDDNPDKFIGMDAKHSILIDMPYNRYDMKEIADKTKSVTFERHSDLAAFTENLIKNIK
jgi:5'(3')-deoxyribonucleotidase